MTYKNEIARTMTWLGNRPRTIFIGQAVGFPGTAMFATLEGVPRSRRLELPVMEDAQLGMAIGMSLEGMTPVCIYPRINFLLLAVNQLVNHLDKLPRFGNGWRPRVIIRTAVAHNEPMDPGIQHLGDYSTALRLMLSHVAMVVLDRKTQIMQAYRDAIYRDGSTLLIEKAARYEDN